MQQRDQIPNMVPSDNHHSSDPRDWQEKLGLNKSEYDPNAGRQPNPLQDRMRQQETNAYHRPSEDPPTSRDQADSEKSQKQGRKGGFKLPGHNYLIGGGPPRILISIAYGFAGIFILGFFRMLPSYAFLLTGGFVFLFHTQWMRSRSAFTKIIIATAFAILLVFSFIYSWSYRAFLG